MENEQLKYFRKVSQLRDRSTCKIWYLWFFTFLKTWFYNSIL